MESSGAFHRPEAGIHLGLTIDGDRVDVRYAAPIRHAPRGPLRGPTLTRERMHLLPGPTSEIVLFVLGGNGAVLDAFGWPLLMDEFFDSRSPRRKDTLTGSPEHVSVGLRVWRVPLAEGARLLYVVRSDAVQADPHRRPELRQYPLALFWIGPPPVQPYPLPPLPVPWPHPPQPTPLPMQPPPQAAMSFVRPVPPPGLRGGRIVDIVPIVEHGPIDSCFNIVVVGDGFTDTELELYDQRVRILFGVPEPTGPGRPGFPPIAPVVMSTAAASRIDLGHMEPFASVWGLINVWSVRTVSEDSGIALPCCAHADCTVKRPANTFYRVSGCFRGKPYPGYIGIDESDDLRIRDAAANAVPIEYAHLIIVIANFDMYGGSAFPERKLAFADMGDGTNLKEWVQLVAHECGHAIAHLAEEDIRCKPKDPAKDYANQTTVAEVNANAVSWHNLADPAELRDGKFRAIHRPGNAINPITGQPVMSPPSRYKMLGAFWGCQNFDTDAPDDPDHVCDNYRDAGGANFYRPMAECRMRKLKYEFCRVCRKEIATRIAEVCL